MSDSSIFDLIGSPDNPQQQDLLKWISRVFSQMTDRTLFSLATQLEKLFEMAVLENQIDAKLMHCIFFCSKVFLLISCSIGEQHLLCGLTICSILKLLIYWLPMVPTNMPQVFMEECLMTLKDWLLMILRQNVSLSVPDEPRFMHKL